MTLSSQTICFEARWKCGVGFIHTQLASSYANAPQQLASSRSTVGFITRDFHALISRQHSQTNRHGLYTLFLTSKSRCMQKISSVDALLTTQNVMSRSGRFGGGHTGWSQLQLASSVSPLCISSRSFGLDLENHVRSVASTVMDGFFLYLAQMITISRGCVACYVFFRIWKFEFFANF